ncbi:PilT/PilU family type 4a pilus ATPase [bacterium]|nr:PilT/PilU family type 4a pilus ATPase [candidate division CSSED10-310 bacterium]
MARIDAFLRLMIEQKASDLHLVTGGEPTLRVFGELLPIQYRRITTDECLNLVFEILPEYLTAEFDEHMDISFAYQLESLARFRVCLFRHSSGVGATFHLIPMQIPSFTELNLPPQLMQFTELRHGLVLVTGSAGSGLSTSLACLIETINRNSSRHILTIENPIEFVFSGKKSLISQREIGVHAPDALTALRHAVRGSADVILISEQMQPETIARALTIAGTGTLVFAAMRSSSTVSAIPRLVDVFSPRQRPHIRSLLSVALKGIVSQFLVQRRGARGRLPVIEILAGSTELSHLIREGKTHQLDSYLENADPGRNVSRDNCLEKLLKQELISIETALAVAKVPSRFHTAAV